MLLFALAAVAAGAKHGDDAQKVTIKNLKYDPAKVTIKVGQTVEWTNKDDNDHTVISDEDGQFDSGNLSRGDTFKFTFKAKGEFKYHCKYHPRMKGLVSVTE